MKCLGCPKHDRSHSQHLIRSSDSHKHSLQSQNYGWCYFRSNQPPPTFQAIYVSWISRGTGYSTSIYLLDQPLKTTQHKNDATITKPSWWFQPIWKILVKLDHFPKVRGENKKYLSCHQPETHPNSATACVLPLFFAPGRPFQSGQTVILYTLTLDAAMNYIPDRRLLQQLFEAGCQKKNTKPNQTSRKGLDDTVDVWNPTNHQGWWLSHC